MAARIWRLRCCGINLFSDSGQVVTRLTSYKLLACPSCGVVHKHPVFGSVSTFIPKSLNTKPPRRCTQCRTTSNLVDWQQVGSIPAFTPPTPFWQRIKAKLRDQPTASTEASYPALEIVDV